jgi:hypothetical protein
MKCGNTGRHFYSRVSGTKEVKIMAQARANGIQIEYDTFGVTIQHPDNN